MKIDIFPVKIEAYDDIQEGIFTLEANDEHTAALKVDTLISRDSWPEISAAIAKGLEMMKLEHGE